MRVFVIADGSDVQVLAAVASGDRAALRVLYDRHAPWLALRLARRCADASIVDETLQDTFLAIWRGAGRYAGQGDVGAWIWGIAIRRLIDGLRRRPRSEVLVAEVDDRRIVEEEVLLGVEYGDLGGALGRLSPELRAVMQATVLDGLT
ncbi:MAG: RNA polymerase sigma factor, partial [Actinobacteria bacterium]|nr:RNA polymerase sigma factor [Actinomycetota bacterium]